MNRSAVLSRGLGVLGIPVAMLVLTSGCANGKREASKSSAPVVQEAAPSATTAAATTPTTSDIPAEKAKEVAPAVAFDGTAKGAPKPVATMAPPPAAARAKSDEADGRFDRKARPADGPGGAGLAAPDPGFGVAQGFSGVKAGEWDDNANFREFQRFLASSPTSHHHLNLNDRRFVVVRDKNGLGIPRCKVTVSDGRQASTSFLTTASGRAIVFPHAEGMSGDKLTATASCSEGSTSTTFPLVDEQEGIVDLKLQNDRGALGARVVDLAFVLDTTGSMSEEIAAVKATIQKVAKVMSTEQTVIRVGLVEYKDRHDPFVTKVYPFASDLPTFAQKVSQISAGGGGDTPEDMNAGLHAAMTQLQWSDKSVARMAFVIADAPPHLDYQDGPDYINDMKTASHRGIQLFTVAASGMDNLGQVVFRQMAQFTGGTNMFVLRGGAGPQSTGGGDPASSCGGTHTNYSSGKLDELIVQKIRRELKSIDADPMRIAGLKVDENAKPCDQRVVFKD